MALAVKDGHEETALDNMAESLSTSSSECMIKLLSSSFSVVVGGNVANKDGEYYPAE